jgi:hypothetical protein
MKNNIELSWLLVGFFAATTVFYMAIFDIFVDGFFSAHTFFFLLQSSRLSKKSVCVPSRSILCEIRNSWGKGEQDDRVINSLGQSVGHTRVDGDESDDDYKIKLARAVALDVRLELRLKALRYCCTTTTMRARK